MAQQNFRVACLGAGYFSQFHYEAWSRMEDVTVIGAADTDIKKARLTGATPFENLGDMLAAEIPNILDIITGPPTHLRAITQAVGAGVKVIICQKPFCQSVEEARQAIEVAQKADASLVVHENFRFQPWYRLMAQAISDGLVGTVHQATFRLRPGDGQGADAYVDRQPYFQKMKRFLIHETAIHFIDTFRFLLGTPTAVYADLRQVNPVISGEDAGYFVLDFESGARALFDGNRHLDHAAANPRLTMGEALIEGDRGTLTLTGDGMVCHRSFASLETREILAPSNGLGFGGDCVYALQRHVIEGLKSGAKFENLASDYLTVIEIEEAIYRSDLEQQKQGV